MGTGSAVTALTDAITAAKMNLKLESVVNADVEAGAAIAFSKLATLASAEILVGSGAGVVTARAVTGDVTIGNTGVTAIASDVIINTDVKSDAAIAFSKLAALTDAHILVGSAANVATDVAVSGDITLSNAGAVAIATGVIINTDVKSDAAIAFSKLAALTSGNILVGSAGGVVTEVTMSGDATIIASGALTIAANAVTIAKIEAALRKGVVAVGPLLQAEVLNATVYFPFKVTINKVRAFTTVIIGGADSVITLKDHSGDTMANGTITIATAGSAVGDEDSASPTTNNVIDADEKIILAHDGGPNAGEAYFTIEYTRTA